MEGNQLYCECCEKYIQTFYEYCEYCDKYIRKSNISFHNKSEEHLINTEEMQRKIAELRNKEKFYYNVRDDFIIMMINIKKNSM